MEIFEGKMIIHAKILDEKILTNGTSQNIDITIFFFFLQFKFVK